MTKRLRSITARLSGGWLILAVLALWQAVCSLGLVPAFMLPSPARVAGAFFSELPVLLGHTAVTLSEAFAGLGLGVLAAFIIAAACDSQRMIRDAIMPVLTVSQTIPTIALAPLLVLWMGYGAAPKVALVFLVCFFPVTVSLIEGFDSADPDAVRLFRSMGANKWQIFWRLKLPGAVPAFFSGLRIAVSYSVVGAVIAEWLGGEGGLGVYMTRVRKSFAFDKMFAVIFWVSALSLILMAATNLAAKRLTRWRGEP